MRLTARTPVHTRSGRSITPPRPTGRIAARLRQIDQWLLDEAIREAKHLDDDFALTGFRAMSESQPLALSDGNRALIDTYLFDRSFPLPPRECVVWQEWTIPNHPAAVSQER